VCMSSFRETDMKTATSAYRIMTRVLNCCCHVGLLNANGQTTTTTTTTIDQALTLFVTSQYPDYYYNNYNNYNNQPGTGPVCHQSVSRLLLQQLQQSTRH